VLHRLLVHRKLRRRWAHPIVPLLVAYGGPPAREPANHWHRNRV